MQALILSGGASRRMGQPKALLDFGGRTFLDHLTATLLAGGCETVTALLGAHAREIRAAGPACALVDAPDWADGMRASLAAGLRALPPGPVLLTHVDRPRVAVSTIAALLERASTRPLVAAYEGRGGHPIILPAALCLRLHEPDEIPLRDLLVDVLLVSTDDPAVLENINTPAAYSAMISSL